MHTNISDFLFRIFFLGFQRRKPGTQNNVHNNFITGLRDNFVVNDSPDGDSDGTAPAPGTPPQPVTPQPVTPQPADDFNGGDDDTSSEIEETIVFGFDTENPEAEVLIAKSKNNPYFYMIKILHFIFFHLLFPNQRAWKMMRFV